MKKPIVALSIAILVVSLGSSLALAAPVAPSASQEMMTCRPTGENSTPPTTTMDQMQTQMQSQQSNGMMTNGSKDMPCQPNSTPSK